nr:608_t:CDS:1 [Entrophospora candida]
MTCQKSENTFILKRISKNSRAIARNSIRKHKKNSSNQTPIDPALIDKPPFPPTIPPCELVFNRNATNIHKKSPNVFFIYRRAFVKHLQKSKISIKMTDLSKVVSFHWNSEPPHVKEEYTRIANEVDDLLEKQKKSIKGFQFVNQTVLTDEKQDSATTPSKVIIEPRNKYNSVINGDNNSNRNYNTGNNYPIQGWINTTLTPSSTMPLSPNPSEADSIYEPFIREEYDVAPDNDNLALYNDNDIQIPQDNDVSIENHQCTQYDSSCQNFLVNNYEFSIVLMQQLFEYYNYSNSFEQDDLNQDESSYSSDNSSGILL